MALDPYRRKMTARYRRGVDDVPQQSSRVPFVVSGIGLLAMLALVGYLGVMGIESKTAQLLAWYVQPPP
jgi:hypothetical protein